MNKHDVIFEKTVEDVELMAAFLAQLVREGVRYEVHNQAGQWLVVLTGGF